MESLFGCLVCLFITQATYFEGKNKKCQHPLFGPCPAQEAVYFSPRVEEYVPQLQLGGGPCGLPSGNQTWHQQIAYKWTYKRTVYSEITYNWTMKQESFQLRHEKNLHKAPPVYLFLLDYMALSHGAGTLDLWDLHGDSPGNSKGQTWNVNEKKQCCYL